MKRRQRGEYRERYAIRRIADNNMARIGRRDVVYGTDASPSFAGTCLRKADRARARSKAAWTSAHAIASSDVNSSRDAAIRIEKLLHSMAFTGFTFPCRGATKSSATGRRRLEVALGPLVVRLQEHGIPFTVHEHGSGLEPELLRQADARRRGRICSGSAVQSSLQSRADPQTFAPGAQPGNAAACFTQSASCASSSASPSWMSRQRTSGCLLTPGGIGRSDAPRKNATFT